MTRRGPWSPSETRAYLDGARIPLKLACIGHDGTPVLASLWFLHREGSLWCATQRTAAVARHLERDDRCAFEVSGEDPPYRGVRGQGTARIDSQQGEKVLHELLERYGHGGTRLADELSANAEDEVAIEIEPRSLVTWDFTERMS